MDFLVKMVDEKEAQAPSWMLDVNGASTTKGYGASVILEKEGNIVVKLSIKFDFLMSKNRLSTKR